MAGRTSQGVRVESSARIPRGLGSAARWGGIGSGLGQGAFDGLGPNDYTTEQRLGRAAISGGSAAAGAATGAAIGLACGPGAPVCSTVGALVGLGVGVATRETAGQAISGSAGYGDLNE